MAWYGEGLVSGTWSDQLPALDIPTGVTYTPLMVGGMLICPVLAGADRPAPRRPRTVRRRDPGLVSTWTRRPDMTSLILFGSFVFLLLIGTPIAFCLGIASLRSRSSISAFRRWSSSSS